MKNSTPPTALDCAAACPVRGKLEQEAIARSGYALVIGGAACVYDDLARIKLGRPACVIAVNEMIEACPLKVDYGCILSGDLIRDVYQRNPRPGDLPPIVSAEALASSVLLGDILYDECLPWRRGSTGLYAVGWALRLRFEQVVLAGIPMDTQGHFYDKAALFDPEHLRWAWIDCLPKMQGRVVSMSGWTKDLLEGKL